MKKLLIAGLLAPLVTKDGTPYGVVQVSDEHAVELQGMGCTVYSSDPTVYDLQQSAPAEDVVEEQGHAKAQELAEADAQLQGALRAVVDAEAALAEDPDNEDLKKAVDDAKVAADAAEAKVASLQE